MDMFRDTSYLTSDDINTIKDAFTDENMEYVLAMLRAAAKRPAVSTTIHTQIRNTITAGRNAPCPCGSGKKFKKCCLK